MAKNKAWLARRKTRIARSEQNQSKKARKKKNGPKGVATKPPG